MFTIDPDTFYIFGVGLIIAAFGTRAKKKRRLVTWSSATATVQNIRRPEGEDAAVVVRFSDATGQLRTATVKVADDDRVGLGGELEIAYDPAKPDQAFVRDPKDMQLAFYLPLAAGLILLGIGLFSQFMIPRAG